MPVSSLLINDYFAQNQGHEHYLFEQTGLQREPWTVADCILSWWHFAQFFSKNGLRDTPALTRPVRRRGAPRVFVDDDAAVERREDVSEQWIAKVNAWMREHGLTPRPPQGPQTPDPKFSHAWVVGGAKTTTGAAVLISDPQTPVWNPSLLYEFHIKGKTFNVRGVGVAGSPAVLIGFNAHVAWGLTALGADQADLFILKTDPARPNQYQVDGRWLDMTEREEVIKIKDAAAERQIVRGTIFGPVASAFVWRNPAGQEVAVSRVPLVEPERETIQGTLGMMRARSCAEFAAALPGWRFPTANCVFGDSQGNIGYWSLGALPIRSSLTGWDGGHAQDGSTRRGMWQGMIPYDILPHCLNPRRGYLVTANHRTIQSFYQVPFGTMTGSSGDTDRGLRVKERILDHLETNELFTSAEVLAIHLPQLQTIDGSTVLSQRAQAYTQFVPLHDVDTARSILPMGTSEDPRSPYRFSTYGDWALGRLHPAPLSRAAVEKVTVLHTTLGSRPEARRSANVVHRPNAPRGAAQSQASRAPLPGKKPDDPTLVAAIRYLNRQERTEQEVMDKIEALRSYVRGDQGLKQELIDGLTLFIHLMTESQAGRMRIRYGTPETLELIRAFYHELTSDSGQPPAQTGPRRPKA